MLSGFRSLENHCLPHSIAASPYLHGHLHMFTALLFEEYASKQFRTHVSRREPQKLPALPSVFLVVSCGVVFRAETCSLCGRSVSNFHLMATFTYSLWCSVPSEAQRWRGSDLHLMLYPTGKPPTEKGCRAAPLFHIVRPRAQARARPDPASALNCSPV